MPIESNKLIEMKTRLVLKIILLSLLIPDFSSVDDIRGETPEPSIFNHPPIELNNKNAAKSPLSKTDAETLTT